MIRDKLEIVPSIKFGYDESMFATIYVSGFMQIMGILQMSEFLGPSFSPFCMISDLGRNLFAVFRPNKSAKKKKIEMITTYDKSNNSNKSGKKNKKGNNQKQKRS